MLLNTLNNGRQPSDTRVVVAMSGGVDSSTVAGLLCEGGYQVIGITLQLYDQGLALQKKGACCAGQDIYDARMVAEKLGIPHYVLNYENIFKESVIDDFAESYLRGETPLPCVKCNQSVKFKDLLQVAKQLNADALVTGHYVQKINTDQGPELHKGLDNNKDQSYFLFATTKEQLDFLHFPLGDMTKAETRKHAERLGLIVAEKPDSQDICFVPDGNYRKLIQKIRPESKDNGSIMHIDGYELGKHEGIINFTVGQRKGLGIATGEPLYVVRIDPKNKIVYVGPENALNNIEFVIKELNWLGNNSIPPEGLDVKIKVRSTHRGAIARILQQDNDKYKIKLYTSEKAITPGLACVIYDIDSSRVFGGGWITRDIS